MLIFLNLFFVSSLVLAACDFQSDVKKVISLSGPVTVVLKEFGLLSHSKLKGISSFHPISKKEFKGQFYPGGIFLSRSTFLEFEGGVVFFDESRRMNRSLTTMKVTPVEIKTRNLVPLTAIDTVLSSVDKYLTGCDEQILALKKKAIYFQSEIFKKIPESLPVLFYLGELKVERSPELIMSNDGIVKLLREEKKIKTYPSDLAYVNWSAKIMRELPEKTLHVGLIDSGKEMKKEIKRSSQRMTVIYPGILVPGLSQLEGFHYWVNSL